MPETPTLDLHGYKSHEVENEVARFIADHLHSAVIIDIITGNSPQMKAMVMKIVDLHGLEAHSGLPGNQGRVRVVMYEYS
jgi:hypothetical protein